MTKSISCTSLTSLACWAVMPSAYWIRAWNWLFFVKVMIFSTVPNLEKIWRSETAWLGMTYWQYFLTNFDCNCTERLTMGIHLYVFSHYYQHAFFFFEALPDFKVLGKKCNKCEPQTYISLRKYWVSKNKRLRNLWCPKFFRSKDVTLLCLCSYCNVILW